MNRKILILLIVLLSNLFAQSFYDLNSEQKELYNQKKFLVIADVKEYGFFQNKGNYENWKSWDVYLGTQKISEDEFYKVVDLNEISKNIRYNKLTGKVLTGAGLGSLIIAYPSMLFKSMVKQLSCFDRDCTKKEQQQADINAALSFGGTIIVLVISEYLIINGVKRLSEKTTTFGEASKVAMDYNKTLIKELLKNNQ